MDPSSVSPQLATVIVVVGLSAILGLVQAACSIITTFRRQPSIDQTLEHYARVADINCIEERNNRAHQEIFNIIRTQQAANEKTFADIERVLGRIEGKLDRCPTVCGGDSHGRSPGQ